MTLTQGGGRRQADGEGSAALSGYRRDRMRGRQGRLRRCVLDLYEHGKDSRSVLDCGRAAAIRRAEPVAANAIDVECGRAGIWLANVLLGYPDLEEGQIRQRVWESRPAMIVREGVFMPHLQMKVALVIARDEAQMGVGKRAPVRAVENADGDGVVVDDREGLIRAAYLSSQKEQPRAQAESEREDHTLRPGAGDETAGKL